MNNNLLLELKKTACKIRMGIIEGTYNAKCGHPGGSLSMTDMITYLYFCKMNVDEKSPHCKDRDRFVLSKGHCAPGLYSALALKGFFPLDELKSLRKIGAMLQGHPDMKSIPGVDMSTGSLGQGVSAACGMALSAKMFGDQYNVYSILGDGELQEGMVWEALMFASHNKLDNLRLIVDNNGLQIDGNITDICSPEPILDKFKAFGFNVQVIDAHDFNQIEAAFNQIETIKDKPSAIIQKSIKGKGVSFMENKAAWHGAAPNKEQYKIAMEELQTILESLEV